MTQGPYKGKSVVVLAGYEGEMDKMLAAANPGFRSRFKQRISFPRLGREGRRRVPAPPLRKEELRARRRGAGHPAQPPHKDQAAPPAGANARDAEDVYDELSGMRAQRLAQDPECEEGAPTFTVEDARGAMDSFDRRRPPPAGEKAG